MICDKFLSKISNDNFVVNWQPYCIGFVYSYVMREIPVGERKTTGWRLERDKIR